MMCSEVLNNFTLRQPSDRAGVQNPTLIFRPLPTNELLKEVFQEMKTPCQPQYNYLLNLKKKSM